MPPWLRKLLFLLPPEHAHWAAARTLNFAHQLKLLGLIKKPSPDPVQLFGLNFPNRLGLAAGFDKNGGCIDALAALGFGFIEIGTVTLRPQQGNAKPRIFRLIQDEALINRMGFNNKGASYVIKKLKKTKYKGILGINIGKNRDTPITQAAQEYVQLFQIFWPYASYIAINISSPNTDQLRTLQEKMQLTHLLQSLKSMQLQIAASEKKYVPLLLKICPDANCEQINTIAQVVRQEKIDGIIATNTTIVRHDLKNTTFNTETGGLSGRPLTVKSTQVIKKLYQLLQDEIPIIGIGGVMDHVSAQEKRQAGAQLVQVYTGLIYRGLKILSCLD